MVIFGHNPVNYFTFAQILAMKKIKYRLVYNRKRSLNNQGTALIQVEASLGKDKIYLSTRIYVRPEEWDRKTSTIVNHPNATDLNTWIYEFMLQLEGIELSLWKKGITPTLLQLKGLAEGNKDISLSFRTFCTSSIEKSEREKSTKYNLWRTLSIIYEFHSNCSWDDLSYVFLKDFEHWLRRKNYATNTVAKHMRNLRTLINEAISAGYFSSDENPFRKYAIKTQKTPHRYLTPEELKILEKATLTGTFKHICDAFLFCCYTGLRFSDFKLLCQNHIIESGGNPWLIIQTHKTGSIVQIPLHLIFNGKALEIIKRYPSIEEFKQIGSNARTNRFLAILQKQLQIKTKITFHTARHTCATLLCHQGVPITTVQKILGHTDLSTTQIYSEIMADTIARDLAKVKF